MQNEDFYKSILNLVSLPLCLCDKDGFVIFANLAFKDKIDISKINSLQEIETLFSSKCEVKEIKISQNTYKIVTIEENENQVHQDFVSTVSHELRTPLTSIRGFADTMLLSSDKLSQEQRQKFLTIIRNQADRLTRLVENLLEVSNISKKDKLIFKEIDFANFIAPIITIFERKYPLCDFEILISPNLPALWVDSDALEQIITNLIDNAAKYSHENSTITIKANYVNDFIEIKIFDEAEKIPVNQLEKIFNKFSRIDNPLTRKVEGSGLGLFITKALTQKLNGRVFAQNYEKGNIFTLELPLSSVEKQLETKISGEAQ